MWWRPEDVHLIVKLLTEVKRWHGNSVRGVSECPHKRERAIKPPTETSEIIDDRWQSPLLQHPAQRVLLVERSLPVVRIFRRRAILVHSTQLRQATAHTFLALPRIHQI